MPLYPKPALPDWADPAQASVMDPLYKTLARKTTSVLGLDDPAGSTMQAAMPMTMIESAPANLIKDLLKLDVGSPKNQATTGLVEQLMSYRAPKVGKFVPMDKVMTRVPTPTRYPAMLAKTVSRIPEAEGLFQVPSGSVKRAPGLPTLYRAESAFRGGPKGLDQETNLLSDVLKGRYNRTAVTGGDNLADVTANADNIITGNNKPLLRKSLTAGANGQAKSMLSRYGITPDDIRLMRVLSKEKAEAMYPQIKPNTLYGIRRGDTFGWVKD